MSPTREFWQMAGVALIIFAILFGMGSCIGMAGMHT